MKARILAATLAAALWFAHDAGAFHKNATAVAGRLQGRAYSQVLSGDLHYREGTLDPALESSRKALRYQQDEPEILYEIANVLVKKGQLSEGKEYLEKALSVDGKHARSRYLLAGILAATGDKEKAISLYSQAISDDPDNEEATLHLSTLYAEKGELDRAREYLTALIERNPRSFLALYYRGRLAAARRDYAP